MAHNVSRQGGRRLDDVRALRLRIRTINLTGNYTAATGEVVTAAEFGFSSIVGVVALDGMARAAAGVTGNPFTFDIAADFKSVTVRLLEDAAGAAGTAIGQNKTDAEAYIASQRIPVLVIGT